MSRTVYPVAYCIVDTSRSLTRRECPAARITFNASIDPDSRIVCFTSTTYNYLTDEKLFDNSMKNFDLGEKKASDYAGMFATFSRDVMRIVKAASRGGNTPSDFHPECSPILHSVCAPGAAAYALHHALMDVVEERDRDAIDRGWEDFMDKVV